MLLRVVVVVVVGVVGFVVVGGLPQGHCDWEATGAAPPSILLSVAKPKPCT